jgi:hypothetical protein
MERRANEASDRRRAERRRTAETVDTDRRAQDRRRLPRRLIDVFRSFLGLPRSR